MIPRSRLYIIIGVIGCALIIVLRDSLVSLALLGAALGVTAVSLFLGLARMADRRRNAAFKVSEGRFAAAPGQFQGAALMLMLVGLGSQINTLLRGFAEPDRVVTALSWVLVSLTVMLGLIVAVIVVLAWCVAPNPVELTPEGLQTRILWDRRFIPWEALAPGGPPRPKLFEGRIRLGLTRPDLVRHGRIRFPVFANSVPANTNVHPWLLADAIRWYAEHPEDRAAIGTEAGHERLLAAVGADVWGQPAPALPGAVKAALRIGYAAVAFGLFSAIADVALLLGFADRLKAYAVEVGERELREYGGEPADWASSVSFSQAWYWIILVFMVGLATIALLALRLLKRGNEAGRIGLIVISGIAICWAVMPCFDMAFEAPDDLSPLLIGVSVLKRLGYLGFGLAVLLLLVFPAARDFTKARSSL